MIPIFEFFKLLMFNIHKYFQHISIIMLLFLMSLLGCSKTPLPPSISLVDTSPSISNHCQGLKIVGPLSCNQFQALFHCLNESGALNSLKPLLIDDGENTKIFTKLYNETFGNSADIRTESLKTIKGLYENGGLDDFLILTTDIITEFIDTPDFKNYLDPLLQGLLTDDHELIPVVKSILLHPQSDLFTEAFSESAPQFYDYLLSLGRFLRVGAETTISTLKNLYKTHEHYSEIFTWEDADFLSQKKIVTYLLETLYHIRQSGRLSTLANLLSDLTLHHSMSVLSSQRLFLLRQDSSPTLLPEQRAASQRKILAHPQNDLASLIKLISIFRRGFSEDETGHAPSLLQSFDHFHHAMKKAFDMNKALGPDAAPTRIMTTYCIYTNLAQLEISDPLFHEKKAEQKLLWYQTNGTASLYKTLLDEYKSNKIRVDQAAYEEQLKANKELDLAEIREKLAERKVFFIEHEWPTIQKSYEAYLNGLIEEAITVINVKKLFLNTTIYDFLMKLKNSKNMAVSLQQDIVSLSESEMDLFINEFIYKIAKSFFDFNRPLIEFMRSEQDKVSGSTWFSYAIDPLIYGFGKSMPLKDQMSLIAVIESMESVDRLLFLDKHAEDFRNVIFPFIKAAAKTHEDDRIFKFFQSLHNGQFENPYTESSQPINILSPLLVEVIGSGLLEPSLQLAAVLGKHADTIDTLFSHLIRSRLPDKPERWILPLSATVRSLVVDHDKASLNFLMHVGRLLDPGHIQRIKHWIEMTRRIEAGALSHESFLTRSLKSDEIADLMGVVQRLLQQNTFQRTHFFFKDLIRSGELKKAIHLLSVLLLKEGVRS